MIIELFLGFLALSLLAIICIHKNIAHGLGFFKYLPIAVIGAYFYHYGLSSDDSVFAWNWIVHNNTDVNLSIKSSAQNLLALLPFIIITFCLYFFILINKQEENKARFVSKIFVNLSAIILLISSDNMFQFIFCSCLISGVAFFMLTKLDEKKHFICINVIADVFLYVAFALIYGQLGNLEFINFMAYEKYGLNTQLVSILIITSAVIKMGLFIAHPVLQKFSSIGFNRLFYTLYLSTPIVGIFLLYKTAGLWSDVSIAKNLLICIAIASCLWAVVAGVFIDSIKRRAIYINMIIFSLLVFGIVYDNKNFINYLSSVLISGYLINNIFYIAHISASNEVYVSRMGGFYKAILFSFCFSSLLVLPQIFSMVSYYNKLWFVLPSVCVLLVVSHSLYQIYFSKNIADGRVLAFLRNVSLKLIVPLSGLAIYLLHTFDLCNFYVVIIYAIFLTFVFLAPFKKAILFAENDDLQNRDIITEFFNILIILPMRIIGRVLWLTIDFSIIDRKILNPFSKFINIVIVNINKLQSKSWLNYLLFLTIGLLFILHSIKAFK